MRKPRAVTIDYSFDPRADRYRDNSNGRFVKWTQVRAQVDRVLEDGSNRLAAMSQRLVEGKTSVADWMREVGTEIKQQYILSAVAARGGWQQMTPSDWGRVGAQLRTQYQYLRQFAEQIATGEQNLDGRLIVRSKLYAQSARGFYEDLRRAQAPGGLERRVRHASESCEDCIEYEARGWQPRGSLPRIGESRCRQNCRCTFEFR